MRLVFMGTPDFAVPALRALAVAGHEIAAVYTRAPKPAGRGQKERPSPVGIAAAGLGLPVRHPRTLRDAEVQAGLAALAPEVVVVVAYGLILPPSVLAIPPKGCLNIHASLLPRWRGAAPIHRAVLAGDTETGVAIMRMAEGLDTGPVLLEGRVPIGAEDTTGDLHDRLAELGARLIVEALAGLDRLEARAQAAEGVTYAAKIDKGEGRIDWTRPAGEVDRLIRGLSPFPGAWTEAGGERVRILRSRLASGSGRPGERLEGLTVACGSGAVEILEAQREGKRAMGAGELLRGWSPPDSFG